MIHTLLLLTLLTTLPLTSQIPDNPLLRLRADSGVTLENDRVVRWGDISGSGVQRTTLEDHLLARYGISSFREEDRFPFTQFPSPMQLFARDEEDSARITIAGEVNDRSWDSIVVTLSRDGVYWKEERRDLEFLSTGASFTFSPTIYADTVEFGLRVTLHRSDSVRVIGERSSLLCGDVLMITGQSNSIFGNGAATWQSRYARSYGSNTGYALYEESDTVWGLSRANGGGGPFAVGVWGLELQRLILENEGIPTAVVNGGVGGSSIEQNLPGDLQDLATIYGRTLYRARRAQVDRDARVLYWYQGESNTIDNYYTNFRTLYEGWLRDYPALEKIYVVQIRPGCSAAIPHLALRELQRTLPDSFANDPVPVISYAPTAAPTHDGCHYGLQGYIVIAEQLYRLTARDIYGSDDTLNIASPTLLRARYGSADRRTILLDFGPENSDLIWQGTLLVNDELRLLRDAFLLDGESGLVASGSAVENRITLRLIDSGTATTITYVPDVYYSGTTEVYEGPWLMNSRGVGAFTFAGVAIGPYDPSGVKEEGREGEKILLPALW